MKKLIYTVLFYILILNISTNVCNAQKLLTTVKTPKGYMVPDTWDRSFPPQPNYVSGTMKTDKSINEISAIQKYAAVTYNATFISSETVLYNCHSFAWYLSELGNIICWMGYKTKTAEDVYWDYENGGYMQVLNEAEASKVSYYLDTTNHSAVTTHTLGIVRSKWGDGALYEHPIGDGPYVGMDKRRYYKLRVNIAQQNSNVPCYNQTKTFTSPSLNLIGATYTWRCSSNLETFSGQGTNTYTVRVNSTAGQLSWVQLDITHQKFSGDNADISKTSSSTRYEFWVGPPVVANVSGPRYNQIGASASYSASISDIRANVTSFNWSLMPGIFNNYFNPGYDHCYVTWNRAGEYLLVVNAISICGTSSSYYYPTTVGSKSYLSVSPNPAADNVQVSVMKSQEISITPDSTSINTSKLVTSSNQDLVSTYTVRIYNSFGTLFYSTKKTGNEFSIPVNNLMDGTYIIEANDGKESYKQQLVVKH
jgi:hypothetical protein